MCELCSFGSVRATVRVSMWVKNVLHIRVVRGRVEGGEAGGREKN